MQKKDIISKIYFQDEKRTADLINAIVFQGRQVVNPEDIQELDSVAAMLESSGQNGEDVAVRGKQKYRDILQKIVLGCRVLFIGIENQDYIHFAMPVRVLGYDYQRYDRQYRAIRKNHKQRKDLVQKDELLSGCTGRDGLEPVITLILYYGEKPWSGPRCLKDMLRLQGFPEEIREYVNDYPLHIVEVARFKQIDLFQTDLRLIFGCLQYQSNPRLWKKFIEEYKTEFTELEEDAFHMITALSHTKQLREMKSAVLTEGGKVNMCKAIDELESRAMKRGEKRGEKRGLERGIKLFILDNQEEGIEKSRIKDKLIRRFEISAEQAEVYYCKYAEM